MRTAGASSAGAKLLQVDLPDFGMPDAMPEIPDPVYGARLDRLRARAARCGYDRLIVYADREHSANVAYLTGFEPRFEEAVLVVAPSADPAILVGNECYGMAGAAPVAMRRHLFQDFARTEDEEWLTHARAWRGSRLAPPPGQRRTRRASSTARWVSHCSWPSWSIPLTPPCRSSHSAARAARPLADLSSGRRS